MAACGSGNQFLINHFHACALLINLNTLLLAAAAAAQNKYEDKV